MLTEALFDSILLNPARAKADTLRIVSGYATATMVSRHFKRIKEIRRKIRVELIVGMAIQDGLSSKDHQAFQSLVLFPDRFVDTGKLPLTLDSCLRGND